MELKKGQIMVFGDGNYTYETEKELCDFVEDKSLIHYVCLSIRPGVEEFATMLEFMHYKPNTLRNDLLTIRALIWNDLYWFVISVPFKEKHFSEEVLTSCGLRVADGVPMMFGDGCCAEFLITGDNVFTLENISNHPVYRNDDIIN